MGFLSRPEGSSRAGQPTSIRHWRARARIVRSALELRRRMRHYGHWMYLAFFLLLKWEVWRDVKRRIAQLQGKSSKKYNGFWRWLSEGCRCMVQRIVVKH